MNAIEALHMRTSAPRLCEPAPTRPMLDSICRSALSAADHGLLKPWRFLIIKGESRNRLGNLFLEASMRLDPQTSKEKQESIRKKPLRAPIILITISKHSAHPKIPEFEQDLSAAAATQNMLTAAFAQGIGAIWRTGAMAYNKTVIDGLGLAKNEKIIGFLYLGTIDGPPKPLKQTDLDEFFQEW